MCRVTWIFRWIIDVTKMLNYRLCVGQATKNPTIKSVICRRGHLISIKFLCVFFFYDSLSLPIKRFGKIRNLTYSLSRLSGFRFKQFFFVVETAATWHCMLEINPNSIQFVAYQPWKVRRRRERSVERPNRVNVTVLTSLFHFSLARRSWQFHQPKVVACCRFRMFCFRAIFASNSLQKLVNSAK